MSNLRRGPSIPKVVIIKTGEILEKIEIDGFELRGVTEYIIEKQAGEHSTITIKMIADIDMDIAYD